MGEGQGVKDDEEKLEYHLIPAIPEELVVRVLMFGKKKYGEDNWKRVPNAKVRYWDAARRHMSKILQGELLDPESGLPHAAHVVCCLLFMMDPAVQKTVDMVPSDDLLKKIDQVAEAYHAQQTAPILPGDTSAGCPHCPHPLTQHDPVGCMDNKCSCVYKQRTV